MISAVCNSSLSGIELASYHPFPPQVLKDRITVPDDKLTLFTEVCSEPPPSKYTSTNATRGDVALETVVEYRCLEGYTITGGDTHLICSVNIDQESAWIGDILRCSRRTLQLLGKLNSCYRKPSHNSGCKFSKSRPPTRRSFSLALINPLIL